MAATLIAVLSTLAIVGGGLLGVWWVRKPDKKGRLEAKEKEEAANRRKYLVEDEILGHTNIPGIPDKDGLGKRAARMEMAISGMQRELHPNGGSSMNDKVNQTLTLVAQGNADIAQTKRAVEEVKILSQQASEQATRAVIKAEDAVRYSTEAMAKIAIEIQTANGLSLAALADKGEGQRILDHIPEPNRTADEQQYVDRMNSPPHS